MTSRHRPLTSATRRGHVEQRVAWFSINRRRRRVAAARRGAGQPHEHAAHGPLHGHALRPPRLLLRFTESGRVAGAAQAPIRKPVARGLRADAASFPPATPSTIFSYRPPTRPARTTATGASRSRRARSASCGASKCRRQFRGKVGSNGFEKVLIGTRGARETLLRGRKVRAAKNSVLTSGVKQLKC